jgi:hypothetical protein
MAVLLYKTKSHPHFGQLLRLKPRIVWEYAAESEAALQVRWEIVVCEEMAFQHANHVVFHVI